MTHTRISRQLWLFSLFIAFCFNANSQEEKISILFTGDVMQHGPQITGAYNKKADVYEYEESFKFIKPIVESKDLAVANLEVTHAGKPYKGYPQFSAPDELPQALKNIGFDVLVTANNHACDGHEKGVTRTLDILDKVGIKHTGTFRNAKEREANYPLIIEKKGLRIAILNYTYGTNGLFVAAPLIINYIDSAVIAKDVAKAKSLKADYIICSMHWGNEYKSLPNTYQQNYEAYCYELGVDMVMGGHPHVLQPIEKKVVDGKTRVTAWSMGNFVSNQRDRYKNGGIFVNTDLTLKEGKVKDIDVKYNFLYVHAKEINGMKPYYVLPVFDYSSYKGFMSSLDSANMQQFFEDSRKLYDKHNLATSEEIIKENSKIGKIIKSHIDGYYTIYLLDKLSNPAVKSEDNVYKAFFLKRMISDGTYINASGMFDSKEMAEEHLEFLKDCKVEKEMKIVFISSENKLVE